MDETGRYSRAALDAAVEALSEPGRIALALRDVTGAAPELEHILGQALNEGGFFATAHGEELRKALRSEDPDGAVNALMAEETRLGMMLGVAIGMELVRELGPLPKGET